MKTTSSNVLKAAAVVTMLVFASACGLETGVLADSNAEAATPSELAAGGVASGNTNTATTGTPTTAPTTTVPLPAFGSGATAPVDVDTVAVVLPMPVEERSGCLAASLVRQGVLVELYFYAGTVAVVSPLDPAEVYSSLGGKLVSAIRACPGVADLSELDGMSSQDAAVLAQDVFVTVGLSDWALGKVPALPEVAPTDHFQDPSGLLDHLGFCLYAVDAADCGDWAADLADRGFSEADVDAAVAMAMAEPGLQTAIDDMRALVDFLAVRL